MSKEAIAIKALEALARLGNGDQYGNSTGNVIARTALFEMAEQPAQQEPVGGEWTPCMKMPVVVHVRKQRLGEAHVSTREGITPVKPDDLIMRGVSGEEYPIGRAIFEQTYTLDTTPQAQPAPAAQQEPVAWPIETNNQVEALAKQCGWDNRRYMTPADYQIWCDRMREFVQLASPQAQPAPKENT